jgi:hypothetical protein
MKTPIALFGLTLAVTPAFAAMKPCDEPKSEIAARLDASGVRNYQLDIVGNDDVKGQTFVVSCEGVTKKITYSKGGAAPAKAPSSSKPSPTASGKLAPERPNLHACVNSANLKSGSSLSRGAPNL